MLHPGDECIGKYSKDSLQEDASEYLEEAKLKELVAKYSEFINFPIYLYSSKQVRELATSDCRHPHAPCVLPCMGQKTSSSLCAVYDSIGVCLLR